MHTHIVSAHSDVSPAAAVAAAMAGAGAPHAGEETMNVSLVDIIYEPGGGWRAVVRVSVEPAQALSEEERPDFNDPYHHHHGAEEEAFPEEHDYVLHNMELSHLFAHGSQGILEATGGEALLLDNAIFYGEEVFSLDEHGGFRFHIPGYEDIYTVHPHVAI